MWKIIDCRPETNGEVVFESEDPKAVLKESNRLEKAAKDDPPFVGEAHSSYCIEGEGDFMEAVAG